MYFPEASERAAAGSKGGGAARRSERGTMSDFDDKIAAAAARVVMAPEAKKRGKCWELFHTVIWGQDGAKHLDVKIALIVGFEIVFLALVLLDAFVGGHLHKHGIHPRDFPMGLVRRARSSSSSRGALAPPPR